MDTISMPEAAILCGGLGTRLRGSLPGIPKALAPVAGQPFLERLIALLANWRIPRVVLCTGVGGAMIREHFTGRLWSAEVLFSEESAPLGTGGALGLAQPLLQSDPVLVLNGDSIVVGLDFEAFCRFHLERECAASFVVVPRDERGDAGTIALSPSGRISRFAEKAALTGAAYHSAGVYLLSRRALDLIPADRPSSLEHDLVPEWLKLGIFGFVHRGELLDIGTPDRLQLANARFSS